MSYKSVILVLILSGLSFANFGQTPTGFQVKRVIIDAGHGGKDPGAIGTGRHSDTESDLALAVSLKLRDYILQYYDSVEVIMTRDTDHFIELRERTRIANEAKADLFISIHCNTNGNVKAYGAETFVMGLAKTKANFNVAKRENEVIFLEDDNTLHYEGFDPSSPESAIALSMMQTKYLDRSILFAGFVQAQFETRVGRKNRGVKQEVFWVISQTIMPSVLIELGFISNNKEEDFLNSEKGQVYMASAIYRAFKEYKIAMEGIDVSKKSEPEIDSVTNTTGAKELEQKSPEIVFNPNDLNPEIKPAQNIIDYRVQVATSTTKLELKKYNFQGYEEITMTEDKGRYKYYIGHFSSFDEAITFQREIRDNAYKDAFLVAFYKGNQISLKEANEVLEQNK